ncbi:MAG: hypothetical protein ACK5DE_10175 [Bacteroidota bacterium]|jgi:hypothetical protein
MDSNQLYAKLSADADFKAAYPDAQSFSNAMKTNVKNIHHVWGDDMSLEEFQKAAEEPKKKNSTSSSGVPWADPVSTSKSKSVQQFPLPDLFKDLSPGYGGSVPLPSAGGGGVMAKSQKEIEDYLKDPVNRENFYKQSAKELNRYGISSLQSFSEKLDQKPKEQAPQTNFNRDVLANNGSKVEPQNEILPPAPEQRIIPLPSEESIVYEAPQEPTVTEKRLVPSLITTDQEKEDYLMENIKDQNAFLTGKIFSNDGREIENPTLEDLGEILASGEEWNMENPVAISKMGFDGETTIITEERVRNWFETKGLSTKTIDAELERIKSNYVKKKAETFANSDYNNIVSAEPAIEKRSELYRQEMDRRSLERLGNMEGMTVGLKHDIDELYVLNTYIERGKELTPQEQKRYDDIRSSIMQSLRTTSSSYDPITGRMLKGGEKTKESESYAKQRELTLREMATMGSDKRKIARIRDDAYYEYSIWKETREKAEEKYKLHIGNNDDAEARFKKAYEDAKLKESESLGKYDAVNLAYFANVDLTSNIDIGTGKELVKTATAGLVEGFGGDLLTAKKQAQNFATVLQQGGMELSDEQIANTVNSISEDVMYSLGAMVPDMLVIMGTSALAPEVSLMRASKLGRSFYQLVGKVTRTQKMKYLMGDLMLHAARGYVTYLPSSSGGTTGVGETVFSGFIWDRIEKATGGKLSPFLTYLSKVGLGTTGETLEEFAGAYTQALADTGFDLQQASEQAFGPDMDAFERNLAVIAASSFAMSAVFNLSSLRRLEEAKKKVDEISNDPNRPEETREVMRDASKALESTIRVVNEKEEVREQQPPTSTLPQAPPDIPEEPPTFGAQPVTETNQTEAQVGPQTQGPLSTVENTTSTLSTIINPEFKNDIVNKLAFFDERIKNKKFPSALEVAEHVLPRAIFNKYANLYELAARNNITVANESLPYNTVGAWAYGNIQLNKNIAKHFVQDYNEFAELLNHEIIHGLISNGVRDNYSLSNELQGVMDAISSNYDNAPEEVKNIIAYIQDTRKEFVEKDILGTVSNSENYKETGSLEELITYAFTNQQFADFLDTIPATKELPVGGESIFQQLKNIIRGFINKKVSSPTALDEINSVIDKYFDTSFREKDIAERNQKYEWGLRFEANKNIFDKYNNDPATISEAYHKAKADGTNPELVKAVESIVPQTTQVGPQTAQEMMATEMRVDPPKPEDRKKIDKLISKMQKAFPGIGLQIFDNYDTVIDSETGDTVADLFEQGTGQTLETSGGTVYGFMYNGKVVLNSNVLTSEVPIHEFGHVWVNLAEKKYPAFFEQMMDILKEHGQEYIDEVKANPNYAQLTEVQQLKEALVTAIGKYGEAKMDRTLWEKIKDLFIMIGNELGLRLSPTDPFNKLLNTAFSELTGGKALADITEVYPGLKKDLTSSETNTNFANNGNTENKIGSEKSDTEQGTIQELVSVDSKNLNSASNEGRGFFKDGKARVGSGLVKRDADFFRSWAIQNNLFFTNPSEQLGFSKVKTTNGLESEVHFGNDGRTVFKINNGVNHTSWTEYIDRLRAHNILFPDAAYTLVGFTEVKGKIYPIVKQPIIKFTSVKVTPSELQADLEARGFKYRHRNYIIDEQNKVTIHDLHAENAVRTEDGRIVYIDPLIKFTDPDVLFTNYENAKQTGEQAIKPPLIEAMAKPKDLLKGITEITQKTAPKLFEKIAEKLSKVFPNAKIVTFNRNSLDTITFVTDKGATVSIKEYLATLVGQDLMNIKEALVKGFRIGDTVYINENAMDSSVLVHEFGHIWENLLTEDQRKYALDLLNKYGKKYITDVKNNPAYKSKTDVDQQREALVTAIGDMGKKMENELGNSKFKNWVNAVIDFIMKKLGLSTKPGPKTEFDTFLRNAVLEMTEGPVRTETTSGFDTAIQNTLGAKWSTNLRDILDLEQTIRNANQGASDAQIAKKIIEQKLYPIAQLSNVLGARFTQHINDAVKELTLEEIDKNKASVRNRRDEIVDRFTNQVIIDHDQFGNIIIQLQTEGYTDFEIYNGLMAAGYDGDTLASVFGNNYHKTIQDLFKSGELPIEIAAEFTADANTLRITRSLNDLLTEVEDSPVDPELVIAYINTIINENSVLGNMAKLLEVLKEQMSKGEIDVQKLITATDLASVFGRGLALLRGFNNNTNGAMLNSIVESIQEGGNTVTASQRAQLEQLVNTVVAKREARRKATKELDSKIDNGLASDEDYAALDKAQIEEDKAITELNKKIMSFHDPLIVERWIAAQSKALLSLRSMVVGIYGNVENWALSNWWPMRKLKGLIDKMYTGLMPSFGPAFNSSVPTHTTSKVTGPKADKTRINKKGQMSVPVQDAKKFPLNATIEDSNGLEARVVGKHGNTLILERVDKDPTTNQPLPFDPDKDFQTGTQISRFTGGGKAMARLSRQIRKAAFQRTRRQIKMTLMDGYLSQNEAMKHYSEVMTNVNIFDEMGRAYKIIAGLIKNRTGIPVTEMTDEEFADAFGLIVRENTKEDGTVEYKLPNGKVASASSAVLSGFVALFGIPSEISIRAIALSGDRMAFNAVFYRNLIDYALFKGITDPQRIMQFVIMNQRKEFDSDFAPTALAESQIFANKNIIAKALIKLRMGFIERSKALRAEYRKKNPSLLSTEGASINAKRLLNNLGAQASFLLSPFITIPINVTWTAMKKTSIPLASFEMLRLNWALASKYSKYKDKFHGKTALSESEKREEEKMANDIFKTRKQAVQASIDTLVAIMLGELFKTLIETGAATPPGGDDREQDAIGKLGKKAPGSLNISHFLRVINGESNYYSEWRKDDKVMTYPNMGTFGFGLVSEAIQASIRGKRDRELMRKDPSKVKANLAAELVTRITGPIDQISLLQSYSGLIGGLRELTSGESAGGVTNFTSSLLKVMAAPIAPNFFSFMERAEGKVLDNISTYYTDENLNQGFLASSKPVLKAWTSLSGRMIPAMRSPVYRAAIGPLGEDLRKSTGFFEPDSKFAWVQMALDPFTTGYIPADVTPEQVSNTETYTALLQASSIIKNQYDEKSPLFRFLIADLDNAYLITDEDSRYELALTDSTFREYLQILGNRRKKNNDFNAGLYDLKTFLSRYGVGDVENQLAFDDDLKKRLNEAFESINRGLQQAEMEAIRDIAPKVIKDNQLKKAQGKLSQKEIDAIDRLALFGNGKS